MFEPLVLDWHDRIKTVQVEHVDFEGNQKTGQIQVLDVAAKHVEAIFREIKKRAFPIHKMELIEKYKWNDDNSMADNNSSAYNPRYVWGTETLSIHAYGLAIDVNPFQNPFVRGAEKAQPSGSDDYLKRNNRPGMVESIQGIFADHGFTEWGGTCFKEFLDYHHFQVPRPLAELLVQVPIAQGQTLFNDYASKTLTLEYILNHHAPSSI